MQAEIGKILSLLETILGKSNKGLNDDLQVQFNCPVCALNKGMPDGDGKYNLEVSLKKMKYNCWVCGQTDNTYGNLSKLIRTFGNDIFLDEYLKCLSSLKESKLYELNLDKEIGDEDVILDNGILLPDGFTKIKNFENVPQKVKNYLTERGITQKIVDKFGIGYVGYQPMSQMSQRIIIPSYDSFGEINYWVGRDYICNKNDRFKQKYKNPNIEKQSIIFNEGKINWMGDITLVEGPFDHICVPNSIPLLGKCLKKESLLYNTLMNKAKSNVFIFLDDDAVKDAVKIYELLNHYKLENKVYIIPCPQGYDAALYFQTFGYKGICRLLKNKFKLNPLEAFKYLL